MNQQSCTGPSWRWMGLSRAGIKSKYIGHTCQGWEELMYVEAHLCLDGKCAAWMPYCFKSMAFWGTTANTWLWPSAGTGSWLTFILFGVNINEEPIQRQWQKASPSGSSIWPAEVVLLCFSLETPDVPLSVQLCKGQVLTVPSRKVHGVTQNKATGSKAKRLFSP